VLVRCYRYLQRRREYYSALPKSSNDVELEKLGSLQSNQTNGTANTPTRIAVILRFIALTFLIVATILTVFGPGVICTGSSCNIRSYTWMHIETWDNLNKHYQSSILTGQYIIFCIELITVLTIVFLIEYRILNSSRKWLLEFIVLIIGIILMLGIGGVECWYASGFMVMDHRQGNWDFTIYGWAAAAAFLFLTAIMFAIDAIFVKKYN